MSRQSVHQIQKLTNSTTPVANGILQRKSISRNNVDSSMVDIQSQSGSRVGGVLNSGSSFDFSNIPIQAKLKIGQPNDKYEQEADRVAEQVMSMPEPGLSSSISSSSLVNNTVSPNGTVQRACASCEEQNKIMEDENNLTQESELIQTKQITPLIQRQESLMEEKEDEELIQAKTTGGVTPEVTPAISSGIQSLGGGGQPLSGSERSFFEPRFGADFSKVKVHNDARAANAARLVNARAFTLGHNVVFGVGEYASDSLVGRKLFAHELTHVVQQNFSQIAIFDSPSIQRSVIKEDRERESQRESTDNESSDSECNDLLGEQVPSIDCSQAFVLPTVIPKPVDPKIINDIVGFDQATGELKLGLTDRPDTVDLPDFRGVGIPCKKTQADGSVKSAFVGAVIPFGCAAISTFKSIFAEETKGTNPPSIPNTKRTFRVSADDSKNAEKGEAEHVEDHFEAFRKTMLLIQGAIVEESSKGGFGVFTDENRLRFEAAQRIEKNIEERHGKLIAQKLGVDQKQWAKTFFQLSAKTALRDTKGCHSFILEDRGRGLPATLKPGKNLFSCKPSRKLITLDDTGGK